MGARLLPRLGSGAAPRQNESKLPAAAAPEKAAVATNVIRNKALQARPQALPRFSGRGGESVSRSNFSFWGVKALVSRSGSSSRGATSLVLDPQQPILAARRRRASCCLGASRLLLARLAQRGSLGAVSGPFMAPFPPALRGRLETGEPERSSWHPESPTPRAVDATCGIDIAATTAAPPAPRRRTTSLQQAHPPPRPNLTPSPLSSKSSGPQPTSPSLLKKKESPAGTTTAAARTTTKRCPRTPPRVGTGAIASPARHGEPSDSSPRHSQKAQTAPRHYKTRRRTGLKTRPRGIYHLPDDRTELGQDLPVMIRIISRNGVDLLQQLGVVVLQGVRESGSHVR